MPRQCTVTGAGLLFLMLAVACGTSDTARPSHNEVDRVQALRGLVTDDLLAELTHAGLRTGTPAQLNRRQLTETQAAQLATAIARVGGPGIANTLAEDRGGESIDFPSLRPCGPILYANSLYADLPEKMRAADRNALGSKWLVTMCSGAEPQLSVSVAAGAVDLRIRGNIIQFPSDVGNELYMKGIPNGWEGALIVGPETALKLAAEATGRRPDAVPELVAADPHWIPQAAQWRIRLSDVPIASGRSSIRSSSTAREVLVGLRLDGVHVPGGPFLVVQVPGDQASGAPNIPSLTFRTSLRWNKTATFVALKEVQ